MDQNLARRIHHCIAVHCGGPARACCSDGAVPVQVREPIHLRAGPSMEHCSRSTPQGECMIDMQSSHVRCSLTWHGN
jgi:hypothetical protein